MADEGQEYADEKSQEQERPRNGPDFRARGREHDELAVGVEPVERVKRRDQERKGGDDRHQVGKRE